MKRVILLSIPGLRSTDSEKMPALAGLASRGEQAVLTPSFPAVTWPVQANMLTGRLPAQHGVIANGFYWRDRNEVEMWTAWNDKIAQPQIWDLLHRHDRELTSAVWFPMLSKGCGADYVCMPAPVHNPDGSESLWCYTKPTEFYGELRDRFGHFPLQHFWGPMANIKSTAWIVDSAIFAATKLKPRFFFLYLPHLDYAAQKTGPNSPQAIVALGELNAVIQRLIDGVRETFPEDEVVWMAAGEYAIVPVSHVAYPNRALRGAGLLKVRDEPDGEHLDLELSSAWALVDHQLSHVFVKDRDEATIQKVADLFRSHAGIAEVLVGGDRNKYSLQHERAGDIVLVSTEESWQAYYWWTDDARAPAFARTVDIHRKPGYDPVELFFDFATKSIPLDASLVKGSHGAPVRKASQQSVLVSSKAVSNGKEALRDIDICGLVLNEFGVSSR